MSKAVPARRWRFRPAESLLVGIVILLAGLGFMMATATETLQAGGDLKPALTGALLPVAVLAVGLLLVHGLLQWRGLGGEQITLPLAGLLLAIGLTMIWRLRPPDATWQQLTRGFLPGLVVMVAFIARPHLIERLRRDWAVAVSLGGLVLLLATAFLGVQDESGARLALKLGPLPAVQTSELVKLALIVFLAWYIEREGEEAEGRARPLLWLRLPALGYFVPGILFVFVATLALVKMSDYGAILILGGLFVGMLYAGFQTRIFLTVAGIALALSILVGLVLAVTWQPPAILTYRLAAFADPWNREPILVAGQPTGVTVAEGPGYQLQQSIYAAIAGGLTGTGLGFGLPGNVPLAHSDFIFAAILEELGTVIGLAILACFIVLLARILRVALLLPPGQVFERLLLVGISVHLFIQVLVMVGGTVNLLPLTGVTVPFLSQGGVALLVNLTEIGLALALAQRLEGLPE